MHKVFGSGLAIVALVGFQGAIQGSAIASTVGKAVTSGAGRM
jgi:hypothetical protein